MRPPAHAGQRAPAGAHRAVLVACAAVTLALAACGAGTSPGTYVGDPMVQAVADELRAEGRAAYYLGPEAAGLALTDVDRVTENGPEFQVWASYGTCHSAPLEEGGCMDPLSVSTMDWRPDGTGRLLPAARTAARGAGRAGHRRAHAVHRPRSR